MSAQIARNALPGWLQCHCGVLAILLAASLASSITTAQAALPDEIQVYDDGINAPGTFGLELHLNVTPSADGAPGYPGEITSVHGFRHTLEPSYAINEQVEVGMYLPFDYTADGHERFAGPRARLKYIARQATARDPWFYGVNFELSHVKAAFEDVQDLLEVRPIVGWRAQGWAVSVNPVVGLPLKPGHRAGGPDFSPAFKVAREVDEGVMMGVEYYAEVGQFSSLLPYSRQSHTLFLAVDVDRKPFVFNLGLGRALTAPADRWTLKAIFELPI